MNKSILPIGTHTFRVNNEFFGVLHLSSADSNKNDDLPSSFMMSEICPLRNLLDSSKGDQIDIIVDENGVSQITNISTSKILWKK